MKSKRLILYSTVSTVIITLIFDLLVASNSLIQFRLIYDIAFVNIVFVVLCTSSLVVKKKEITRDVLVFAFPFLFFLLAILINLKAIFCTLQLEVPNIGFLDDDILIQGASSLIPLLDYLLMMIVNGILLYVAVNRRNSICAYKIPTYVLGVTAIETSWAIYCFHIGGIAGIRLGLALFHVTICGVIAWLFCRHKIKEIHIKTTSSDLLLLILSIGIFMMIYIPHGIYSLFGDSAVVVGSTSSIVYRGGLHPYYIADAYYGPIGGFVATVFTYLCGLDNILLASSIPFLTAHIMLPFVTYHFLIEFVSDDWRIAIIGSVVSLLMDGLAVILLPAYIGSLSRSAIEWQISPATKSLYFSSTSWIWLAPYKTMGMACATAVGNILPKSRTVGLLLGGALLGFSFINPRQPFLAILILIFLLGINRVNLKEIIIVFLATAVFLGPILPETVFKMCELLFQCLHETGLVVGDVLMQTTTWLSGLANDCLLLAISISITSVAGIVVSIRPSYKRMFQATKNMQDRETVVKDRNAKGHSSFRDMAFLVVSIALFVYIIVHTWIYSTLSFTLPQTVFLEALNHMILRYHILVILIVIGFLGFRNRFKYSPRISAAFIALTVLTYLGIMFTLGNKGIIASLPLVIVALPTFGSFVKSRKRIMISVVLLFVLLGVFSASLYSATVTSLKSELIYRDLPNVLPILLNVSSDSEVFPVSSNTYYASRMARMANLQVTSIPSHARLFMIDKMHTNSTLVGDLIKNGNSEILYDGNVFIIYEPAEDVIQVVPNSGFELGDDNPYNWTSKKTDASHEAWWDNTTAKHGNHSLNLSVEEDSEMTWVRWESDRIFMTENASLSYLEYHIKQDLDVGSSLVQLNFYNDSGDLVMYDRVWQSRNSDWILRTNWVNFPRKFEYMTLHLVNLGEGKVWFDDIKLYVI